MSEALKTKAAGQGSRRPGFKVQSPFLPAAIAVSFAAFQPLPGAPEEASRLDLKPGERICIIGNALAERMQFDGWLETILQSRFPRHELVIRNLGYSGDELTLRLRSEGFGSPDDHLTQQKADVILAFFGFNESFGGPRGLEKFQKDLEGFVQGTLGKRYNGKTAPRLVLFSPIAHEDLKDPNLPDGSENNRNLKLYSQAIEKVARQSGVPFVDLFTASLLCYANEREPLTLNGIHLIEGGNKLLAQAIDRALFPSEPESRLDPRALENLRSAVLEKCFYWFQRHRVVDGYSVYGGRSHLRFVDGQTNREVMEREMEILDVMTANRDRQVWARARGEDLPIDDQNTPPFIPVKTNKPGKGPGGTYLFLDGEEAMGRMKVAQGMEVNLFASEKEFPELQKPVQMAFDPRGRLFVAVMPSYPHWKPKDEMNDKILILEDTDRDGRADRCQVFADRLHVPTGLEFWGGGLFVGQGPFLLYLKDKDADDRADFMERVLHGVDTADTHHTMNSFVLDPGGALYFQEGTFHHSQVETLWGPQRCANAGVFRYEPRTQKFEVYVSYAFANPHGHVFARWGQDFVTDGTGNVNYYATAFSGRIDFPAKHPGMRPFFKERTRPCPGTEILSSRHFPQELQGNYLVANVIGFQGILQYRIRDQDSGFTGEEVEPIVQSADPNFRPSDIEIGPDGAIYFLDWQNPIIGHMQHHLRDPSRDHTHGRVYRITYHGRPLLEPARIAGEPARMLLDLLKEPEDRVRYRARIELSGRSTTEAIAAVKEWLEHLDPNDPDHQHHLLEALWVHQQHNVVHLDLLKQLLGSEDFRARAAATRVLCYWRDRVPGSLDLLKGLAADPYPRVRLEAVRAASFYQVPEAVEVVLISAEHPLDYYLEYTGNETLRALEPHWKKALAERRRVPATSPAGARFFFRRLKTEELLGLERDASVCVELLSRKGVEEARRGEALRDLARLEGKSEMQVLLNTLRRMDRGPGREEAGALYDLALLLVKRDAGELASVRKDLERLAAAGNLPVTRQVGFVALVLADGSVEEAWKLGLSSAGALGDLVSAMPLIPDPTLRASLYPKVDLLLDGLPRELEAALKAEGGGQAGLVRRAAMDALPHVRGQETRTFRRLARFVREGIDREAAVRALERIPPSYRPPEEARPLLESLLAHVRGIPARDRTSPAAREALQLAETLSAQLSGEEARRVRAELGELGVRVIRITAVPHQMLYDKDRIAVAAGKPVEIVLENTDLMPHNLVLTQAGALEEVGLAAEAMATQPGALERHYVPASPKVIVSTKLLGPRESDRLSFTAPADPGVYPYVCTYPGHWRRMFGAMYVVEDLEKYLAGPDAYLEAHPTPALDELLKFRRPRKEWKMEELTSSLDELGHGRAFDNGKQMFQVANCVACHRLDGTGLELGPDLTQLDPKLTPAEILRDLLEPSARINEKYHASVFVTRSGKLVTGLVVGRTPEAVKVLENALLKPEPVELKTAEVVQEFKSSTSVMPEGLLNQLTREEILDLLAFIVARGNRNHQVLQGGCGLGSTR